MTTTDSSMKFFKMLPSSAGSSFFRDDTRLRALRFLDHLLVCICYSPLVYFPGLSSKVAIWCASLLSENHL
jgi:hypothetical protein